jgi:hypothetical protein
MSWNNLTGDYGTYEYYVKNDNITKRYKVKKRVSTTLDEIKSVIEYYNQIILEEGKTYIDVIDKNDLEKIWDKPVEDYDDVPF